ncbi:putative cyclase-associated protein CAP/septum formation inhibitor MinC [Helianthus annuus]|uniref:Cyclase-associated protein CAP/septum formation inhibitor MinC n=2 Tax=Helianthus annuus TaxID=4232 RepID=A0A251RRC0_HELAN|nr:putative cyclase-associated protein CAP/septum formation inhibitor MinC [Helianthus annuus]KAJ0434292.1 putative cyclase-associated protein CAP/septum formation inhibitor MinC [Helianthus annuus]
MLNQRDQQVSIDIKQVSNPLHISLSRTDRPPLWRLQHQLIKLLPTTMNDQQAPSATTDGMSTDPTIQRKHAAMIERLSNLHQSRVSNKTDPKDPSFESTKSFLLLFTNSKQAIESSLTQVQQISDTDPTQDLKPELEKMSLSITELEKLVAENSYFLPPYEVRSSLKTISDLKQTLDSVTSKVKPRKKFSFKNRPAKKPEPANTITIEAIENEREQQSSYKVKDSPGFRSKENEILTKEFKGSEIGEFVLSDLTNCEVRLRGCFRTLFINRLKNCKIYTGPVLGSILIEEVEGCLFVVASHQIRIHDAKESDFYLRCRSRPIIERSSGVRFAPYRLCYDGIESDLRESNLDDDTGSWANVDDFQWLRAVQSPNWSILPESQRIDTVNI